MQKSFAALMIGFAMGKIVDISQEQKLFGPQLRSVQEYANQVLGKAA